MSPRKRSAFQEGVSVIVIELDNARAGHVGTVTRRNRRTNEVSVAFASDADEGIVIRTFAPDQLEVVEDPERVKLLQHMVAEHIGKKEEKARVEHELRTGIETDRILSLLKSTPSEGDIARRTSLLGYEARWGALAWRRPSLLQDPELGRAHGNPIVVEVTLKQHGDLPNDALCRAVSVRAQDIASPGDLRALAGELTRVAALIEEMPVVLRGDLASDDAIAEFERTGAPDDLFPHWPKALL